MNFNMNNLEADDQRLLDLLVDGELPEEQRRELLLRLDRDPGGWRRCALAYLEAQSWSGGLRQLAREPSPSLPSEASSVSAKNWWNRRTLGTILALAASVLAAFGIGFTIRDRLPRDLPQLSGAIASQASSSLAPARGSSGQWGQVQLVVDGSPESGGSPVQVPVIDQPTMDNAWLLNRPSAMPADVQRVLERMGNQVQQQRQLMPFQLEDGRRVVVPVDQIDVRPVSHRGFQ
jgi:hypothetical protein